MFLHKTDKARDELRPGNRSLSQRERSVLLLADGTRSLDDFKTVFHGEGYEHALKLVREGYLERRSRSSSSEAASTPPFRPSQFNAPVSGFEPTLPGVEDTPVTVPPSEFPSPETTQAIQAAADPFVGKRSLATTRMFLFDICERMFARRDPKMCDLFREALRQAKDRESMMGAAHLILHEIEKVAGPERADSISERLAMLLPDNLAA
jgi:hypothetical protein